MRYARLTAIGITALLESGIADADAGVPMLFVTFPAMLVALVPIIVVEVLVLGRMITSRLLPAVKPVAIANIASTVVGIPIAWIVLVILDFITGGGSAYGLATPARKLLAVTWQAPWLIPYGDEALSWMIPSASLALLVPFFFTSYVIEAWIVSSMMTNHPAKQVRRAVFFANMYSYALLAMFNVAWLVWSVIHLPRH